MLASSLWLGRSQESSQSPPAGGSRIPWLSSRVIGSPEPPPPYQVERVFPQVKFKDPVDLCAAPGSDRLFTAVLAGKVYSFKNDPSATSPRTWCLILLNRFRASMPFMASPSIPGLPPNPHYLFVCLCVLKDGLPDGSRVSRFYASLTTIPPGPTPRRRKVLVTWFSGGHNGGCLKIRAGWLSLYLDG